MMIPTISSGFIDGEKRLSLGCPASRQKGNDCHDEEDDEQDLSDPGSGACDAAESEDSGNDRDDEKCNGVV